MNGILRLRRVTVTALAFLGAIVLTVVLLTLPNGRTADAAESAATNVEVIKDYTDVACYGSTDWSYVTEINTETIPKLRVTAGGDDVEFKVSIDGSYVVGYLKVAPGNPTSLLIDLPGKTLTVEARCTNGGNPARAIVAVYKEANK